MARKPRNSIRPSGPAELIRSDLRDLRECMSRYEKEAANLAAGDSTEADTQRYQAALRELLDALIRHAGRQARASAQAPALKNLLRRRGSLP